MYRKGGILGERWTFPAGWNSICAKETPNQFTCKKKYVVYGLGEKGGRRRELDLYRVDEVKSKSHRSIQRILARIRRPSSLAPSTRARKSAQAELMWCKVANINLQMYRLVFEEGREEWQWKYLLLNILQRRNPYRRWPPPFGFVYRLLTLNDSYSLRPHRR